jgi:hypothetical protein
MDVGGSMPFLPQCPPHIHLVHLFTNGTLGKESWQRKCRYLIQDDNTYGSIIITSVVQEM